MAEENTNKVKITESLKTKLESESNVDFNKSKPEIIQKINESGYAKASVKEGQIVVKEILNG